MSILDLPKPNQALQETYGYENDSDGENHFDSIIPTSEAYKIESRKSSFKSMSQLKQKSKDFYLFQSKSLTDLKEIIAKYRYSLETLSVHRFPIRESLELKTAKIKDSIKRNHEEKLIQLKKQFEENKQKFIDNKREKLQKFWRGKVFELNGTLQQTEWKINSKQSEEDEKAKKKYEKAFKDALEIEKNLLESEIEEHYNKQFQDKLNDLSQKSIFRDEAEFRASVEEEFLILRVQERMKWDIENKKKLKEDCEKIFEIEASISLKKQENEIKEKFRKIVKEKIDSAEIELFDLEKLEKNRMKIRESGKELQEKWTAEAELELKYERITAYKSEIFPDLNKEINKNRLKSEVKLAKKDQEILFREIGDELSTTFELFKQEIEKFYKSQIKQFEDSARLSAQEKIQEKIKENLAFKEKEALYKHTQNTEKQKNSLKKQFEEKELTELKKIREIHSKEKQNYTQFKSYKGAEISKLDEKIKSKLLKLEEDLFRLGCKVKGRTKKPDPRVLRKPNFDATSNLVHYCKSVLSEQPKHTPTELIPTCSSAGGVRVNEFYSKFNSPSRTNSPKDTIVQVKTTEKPVQNNSVKSLSYDHSKISNKDLLAANKLRQNMYHELLKEKFGYIKPRLK